MTKCLILFPLLVLAASSASRGQTAPPPQPLIRENATEKLAAHVYWIGDNDVPQVCNIGIIVGDRGTLVIDTGLGPRNGQTVAREAAKVSRGSQQFLAMTHFHPEHDLGAQGFSPTTKVLRAKIQDQDIAELGLGYALDFALASPFNATLLKGVNFRRTDISFDRDYRLDLGGVHVRMSVEGPAHTRGDTVFVVEEDRVIFAGDIVMPAFPAFQAPYSSVRSWASALERLERIKPTIVVPAHGRLGDATMISTYRDYFNTLERRAAALKKEGKSADDAARIIQGEMTTMFPSLAYRGVNRVALAARTAYSEAQ